MGRGVVVLTEPGDERRVFVAISRQPRGSLESLRGPRRLNVAPAARRATRLVEALEKLLVAVPRPLLPGLLHEGRRLVDRWQRHTGVVASKKIAVALEHAVFERFGTDHVVGHEQELLPAHPIVVPADDLGQFLDVAGLGVTRDDQVQHGHEVALTTTEAAVEVAAVARTVCERLLHDREGPVEAADELVRDDVFADRRVGVLDTLGEPQHKPVGRQRLGDVDQFAEEGHWVWVQGRLNGAAPRQAIVVMVLGTG